MLIDTSILIWIFEGRHDKFGTIARRRLETEPVIVSVSSLFEMAAKRRKGKLDMPDNESIVSLLNSKEVEILPIKATHISFLPKRSAIKHADPFDLLIMAQAISEKLELLTNDPEILGASVPGLMAVDRAD